jgi:hypothetical protein
MQTNLNLRLLLQAIVESLHFLIALLCFKQRITAPQLPGPTDSPAPINPQTDSTCPWCHSEVTLPDVSSSAHELPWLPIICSYALQDQGALLSSILF